MSQEMYDTHMQIRFGVESELSYDQSSCDQCLSGRKRSHFHCSKALVSGGMLSRSNAAYLLNNCDDEEIE